MILCPEVLDAIQPPSAVTIGVIPCRTQPHSYLRALLCAHGNRTFVQILHDDPGINLASPALLRFGISKYLVQWDKDASFRRSQVGGVLSHADAAAWSEVVVTMQYQVLVRINNHSAYASVADQLFLLPFLIPTSKRHCL